MSDYSAIDAGLITEDDYDAEISRLRAALEAAERERDDALADKAHVLENWVPAAERDALKEQVEAARDGLKAVVLAEQASDEGWQRVYRHAQSAARAALARLGQREGQR